MVYRAILEYYFIVLTGTISRHQFSSVLFYANAAKFFLQVLALVGLRKAMDYCPSIFSQSDLFWLDNLMPDSKKDKKKGETSKDVEEDQEAEAQSDHEDKNEASIISICYVISKSVLDTAELTLD